MPKMCLSTTDTLNKQCLIARDKQHSVKMGCKHVL